MKRRGPNTEPRGTPAEMVDKDDKWNLNWARPERYEVNQARGV